GGVASGCRKQSGIIVTHDRQIATHREDTALLRVEAARKIPRRGTAYVDARTIRLIVRGTDHYRRRESSRSVSESRGEVGCSRILNCSWRIRYDYLARDEIGDVVAVGVAEHPAGREWVEQMVRWSRLKCDERSETHQDPGAGGKPERKFVP